MPYRPEATTAEVQNYSRLQPKFPTPRKSQDPILPIPLAFCIDLHIKSNFTHCKPKSCCAELTKATTIDHLMSDFRHAAGVRARTVLIGRGGFKVEVRGLRTSGSKFIGTKPTSLS